MAKWLRISIIVFLLLALIGGGVYYYRTSMNKKEFVISDIYKYIPTDAAIILEAKNPSELYNHLNKNCKPWSLLMNVSELNRVNSYLRFFDSLMNSQPLLKTNINKGPAILSFHPIGKNDYQTVFIFNIGNHVTASSIEEALKEIYHQNITFSEKIYSNETIYIAQSANPVAINQFTFCFIDGLFIASTSSLMIENVIRQTKSNFSLLNEPSFHKTLITSGQHVDANIFINHKLFPKLWVNWLSPSLVKKNISKRSIAEWSAIDLHASSNMFLLNGFTDLGDSPANYLKALLSQSLVNISLPKVLPKETNSYLFLGVSDFDKFQENYSAFLESYGLSKDRNMACALYKKKYFIDIIKLFKNLISDEVGIAFSNRPEASDILKDDDIYFVIKTDNQSSAKELLDSIIRKAAVITRRNPDDNTIPLRMDADYSCNAYSFPIENAAGLLFGSVFSAAKTKYFTYVDNYIIFSGTKEALQRLQYANTLKKTLSNEPLYQSYTNMLDNKCNLLFYCDIARSQNLIKSLVNVDLGKNYHDNYEVFRQMDAMSCQLSINKDMLYTSIFIRYSPEVKEYTHTLWESKLDTTISMKPFYVENSATQEKEIFVQDNDKNIYLLNSTGRILWKEAITEKITSEIYQIDMLHNKKLQYLFSTRNNIYLMDKNGEMISPYPVKLKAPATNGVSVATINAKKELRLYIACNDKKVYCYTLSGKLDKNWKFETTNHFVYQPVQFVSYGKKDYFFFNDSMNVYILDKTGKTNIKVEQHFAMNHNARLYFETKNRETDARFVINSLDGNIKFISLDGTIKTLTLEKRNPQHYYLYNDIDGDGYADHIFVDDDELIIYSRIKKVMLKYSLPSAPTFRPVYYEFPMAKNKIGLVCKNQILLIDKDGKMPNGFPLKGVSLFSISHFEKPIRNYLLLTGSDNGYLLNYEVY